MKKTISLSLALITGIFCVHAQTKVFKEVSNEISSQIKTIRQDNNLVGYLAFTRLEKASADSFNYKITIMDENLNDIGIVTFKESGLVLQDISFEQDVLCIAYLKSDVIGNSYSSREYKNAKENAKSFVQFQFLNLDGKIIKTNTIKAGIDISGYSSFGTNKLIATGNLKYSLQLNNIPQKGFACFYGDADNNSLLLFDTAGEQVWQKKINTDGQAYIMRTTQNDIYLLEKYKQEKPVEGGYQLLGYSLNDGTAYDKYLLKDKEGNDLKVLAFDNDPVTGNIYLSGNIINTPTGNRIYSGRDWSHGPYSGLFTVNVNGSKKSDMSQVCTYWSDGSQEGTFSKKGMISDNKSYPLLSQSFKDYEGNTYFVGSTLIKKVKWGSVASSVILAPLVLPTIGILAMSGTGKCKLTDVVLIKQNVKGVINIDNTIAANNTNYYRAMFLVSVYNNRDFYRVTNSDTKTNYLIIDDTKDIIIYNTSKRKTVRSIPHADGQIKTNVYPAKEGYIMVSEYNKKEKYTRFSIEAL